MTGVEHPAIRTPDQRIRVFVSSTLRELADERAIAKAAIERLRLAPVMFELGARPHPPRELYRSYLAQSDVFVGIYGASYGWVAPGEDVSGLEDEYDLAPQNMPKLIYIKDTATRDERLTALIERIQNDDTAAYLHFSEADDLAEHVTRDLATLLAERFDESREAAHHGDSSDDEATQVAASTGGAPAGILPTLYTATIGRDDDIARVRALLGADDHRVVSLIGPGGIGKSRLAIEVARAGADLFPDGVRFVLLEGVLEPDLLLPTIAYSLGVRDSGDASLEDRVARALAGKRMLIVLDNFEQIVQTAPTIVRLYEAAPHVTFLVTSRVVLRIRGEQVYEVGALDAPAEDEPASLYRATQSAAVALFVERARAVRPDFALNESNAADVVAVCRRLEGLPLAIELAAAKMRALTPAAIAERLESSLPLLTAASRDVPERHRTMTAAIEWSVSLLPDVPRDVLEDLGVFATRFTLEAVEALGESRPWAGMGLDALSELIDASLVTQTDVDGEARFSLLAIVREYAMTQLRSRGEAVELQNLHADFYLAMVRRVAPTLRGPSQPAAVRELGLELSNLRAAVRHLVHVGRLDDAADFAWRLLIYWWISGFLSEVRLWMIELLDSGGPVLVHTRAVATFYTMWGDMWRQPSGDVIEGLARAEALFRESGDPDGAAMMLAARGTARLRFPDVDAPAAFAELTQARDELHALDRWWAEVLTDVGLGLMSMGAGQLEAAYEHFTAAVEIGKTKDDAFSRVVAGNNLARMDLLSGRVEAADAEYRVTLALARLLQYDEGAQYAFEGLSAIAALRGDAWRAGALCAVAEAVRERVGLFDVAGFAAHTQPIAALRAVNPDAVAAGERAGAEMSMAEAFAVALPESSAAHAPAASR